MNAARRAVWKEVPIVRQLTVAAFCLSLVAGVATAQEQKPNVTRTPVGDWTKLCINDGADCVIEQIGKTAEGEEAFSIQVEKLATPQDVNGAKVESVANIRVPLGVVLTQGLRLKIDQGQESVSPYFICQPNGCVVRAPLQPELLTSLKAGAKAQFTFTVVVNSQPKRVPIDISLSGFTRAYDGL